MLSFRRPPNVKDILVPTALRRGHSTPHTETGQSTKGYVKCINRTCRTCCHIDVTSCFTSYVTGKSFEILQATSCRSVNAFYLIQCARCDLQYVGETGNNIRQRMSYHRSTINHFCSHLDKPFGVHFSSDAIWLWTLGLWSLNSRTISLNFDINLGSVFGLNLSRLIAHWGLISLQSK